MTKARPGVMSLNGGEVDAEAIARSDMESYANKSGVMENGVPALKGGMFRAPGSRFIGRTLPLNDHEDMAAIVRTWRFSRSQAFTLELSHERMRIVFGVGYVQTGPGQAEFNVSGWADDSTDATTLPDLPTWPTGPFDPLAPGTTYLDDLNPGHMPNAN